MMGIVPEPVEDETHSSAPVADPAGADGQTTAIRELSGLVAKLLDRMSEVEDAVAESSEEIGAMRKELGVLSKSAVKKKHLRAFDRVSKKINALLDRIEVIEDNDEAPGDLPGERR